MISRKKPAGDVIIGAVLAFLGIGLLSFSSGSEVSGTGVALALSAAFSYAWAIIITDKVTKEDDALTIGMLQVGFMGLFGLIASMIFESPHLPQTGTQWAMIIYLAAVCSDFGFTFQTIRMHPRTGGTYRGFESGIFRDFRMDISQRKPYFLPDSRRRRRCLRNNTAYRRKTN